MASKKYYVPETWKVALLSTGRVAILGAVSALITHFSPLANDNVEFMVLLLVLKYADKWIRTENPASRGLTLLR